MGVFILFKSNVKAEQKERAERLCGKMGLKDSRLLNFANFSIRVFVRPFVNEYPLIEKDGHTLICSGMPIYPGSPNLKDTLEKLLEDLLSDRNKKPKARGNYSLLLIEKGKDILLLRDGSDISNIYYSQDQSILSNSFLAVSYTIDQKLSPNLMAMAEVISSGRLIGPETLFNEVIRLNKGELKSIEGVKILRDNQPETNSSSRNYSEEIEFQLDSIGELYKDTQAFAENYGVDIGITGGHDSRMVAGFANKYFSNFQLHSFWRKNEDTELKIARKVSDFFQKELKVEPAFSSLEADEKKLEDTLEASLLFYDGHIRMHCYLMEPFHVPEYRKKVLGEHRLGMGGVGGEQYRNEWHNQHSKRSLNSFVKYDLSGFLSGEVFSNKEFNQTFRQKLKSKLKRELGITGSESLKKIDIQAYYNEVYVASLLGARFNSENIMGFYFTPFTDPTLTGNSYSILNHEPVSFEFQQEMIRRFSPDLAAVDSGYGYDFLRGESKSRRRAFYLKDFIPKAIYAQLLKRRAKKRDPEEFHSYMKKFKSFEKGISLMDEFGLPINVDHLGRYPNLWPVLLSLAFMLGYLKRDNRI